MERERRYSDREAEALLARAVELSRPASPAGGADGAREGLSLAELERVAAEAGLPVEALRRAAEELESRRFGGGVLGRLKGTERAVLNAMPGRAALDRLLVDLPDLAGLSGSGSATETGLVWRSDGGAEMRSGRKLRVEVRAREGTGGAVVEVRHDLGGAAGGIYGGIVGGIGVGMGLGLGLGIGLGTLGSPLFALLFSSCSILLSALGARGLVALFARYAERASRRVAARVAEAGAATGPS